MRQIGTVANENEARALGDYLLTLQITTRMERGDDGWKVWIHDEDHVERARQELAVFKENPSDARYHRAAEKAEIVRKEVKRREEDHRRRVIDMRERWYAPARPRPLTIALIVVSVAVSIATRLGEQLEPIQNRLTIAYFEDVRPRIRWLPGLPDVRAGEVWRLVTPIFLHFGPIHLLFNMYALYVLGGVVEIRRGTWRMAVMVLVIAVLTNLAQFYIADFDDLEKSLAGRGNPRFGGMSGVLFGLLGYMWMKSRFDPGAGIYLHPNTVTMMLVWLVVCMTGLVGNVANTAHVAGLLLGMAIGYAPFAWRRMLRRW